MNREKYNILQKRLKALEEKQAQLKKKKQILDAEILHKERQNKLLFFSHPDKGYLGPHGTWEPNPAHEALIKAFMSGIYTILALTGANQIGKTFFEVIFILSCIRGHFPWENRKQVGRWIWKLYGWTPPIIGRWVGGDWENHIKANLVTTLEELLPESWKWKSKTNHMGAKATWTDPETNGHLFLMSSKQDVGAFAGWKGNFVVYDEPFPTNIWAENFRGLLAKNGIVFIGASLVEEDQAWIEDDILMVDNKQLEGKKIKTYHYEANMLNNLNFGLNKKSIEMAEEGFSKSDKKIRMEGKSAGSLSALLKINPGEHYIEKSLRDLPRDYLIDISIDYHPNKPQHILFLATGPYEVQYICFELVSEAGESCGAHWIVDSIMEIILSFNLRINRIIADPLSDGDRNVHETTGTTTFEIMSDRFADYGYFLEKASKTKSSGIIMINDKLRPQIGKPSLFFMESVPIAKIQCKKWRNDKTGKPSKDDDDQCENLYRLVSLETKYDTFNHTTESNKKRTGGNSITGY